MPISFQKSRTAIVTVCLSAAFVMVAVHEAQRAGTSAALKAPAAVAMVSEIAGYKNWTKVNSTPQLMPERVATDCAIRLSPTGVDLDDRNNPHLNKYFTVYVNELGGKAMLTKRKPNFPEGSVIVKEKLSDRFSQTPELLTVMIKQRKGFNPASGDWEYMVVDGSGTKIEGRGDLQNCQSCHLANKKADYVFRSYLSYDQQSELK